MTVVHAATAVAVQSVTPDINGVVGDTHKINGDGAQSQNLAKDKQTKVPDIDVCIPLF